MTGEDKHNASKKSFTWERLAIVIILLINIIAVVFLAITHQVRTNPNLCGTCHAIKPYVDSYLNSNHMDNIHYQANVGCKDCHTSSDYAYQLGVVWRYLQGDGDKFLSRRTYDQKMCTRCHISMAYHADRTDFLVSNPHASHWPDLVCDDCHLAHDEQIDYCGNCHENGGQRMTGQPVEPRADNPWRDLNASPLK